MLDQTSNSELKPLFREKDLTSQLCCHERAGGGAWCVNHRGRGKALKPVQNKANVLLWDNFGPKPVACFPAFGTTTPIVWAETKWSEGDKTKNT